VKSQIHTTHPRIERERFTLMQLDIITQQILAINQNIAQMERGRTTYLNPICGKTKGRTMFLPIIE